MKYYNPSGVSKLTDPIDEVLPIPNIKFVDLAMILSSYIKVLRCCNALSWPILPVN